MTKDIQPFKDKVLFFRLKSGDKEAFGQIYDLYVDKIYRFIYFKVSTKEEAEDLTSETFLKIWNYVNQKEEEREVINPRALLYKIAHGLIVNFYRSSVRKSTINIDEQIRQLADERQDLAEEIAVGHEVKQIEEALRHLKNDYRDVVMLRYVEEFAINEIAKILNKTPGAVRTLLHRALKALKEIIEEEQNNNE